MAFISSRKTFLKAAANGDMAELSYCIAQLIPSSFDINVRNGAGKTAVYLAAENGQMEALKMLIAAQPDLNVPDTEGCTPLAAAIGADKPAAARLLIASGADVNQPNENYVTPLLTAARNGQIDVVKDLVAAHADLNAVSRETGRTGLHWAVDNGHAPVIEFLAAQKGMRTDIVDRDGRTPADIARKAGNQRILTLLETALRAVAAAPAAVANDGDDTWGLLGDARVAHVASSPLLGRKITEIFNFENRERLTVSENLKTGAESTTQPEKFDTLPDEVVARAEEQLKKLGGAVPDRNGKKAFNL